MINAQLATRVPAQDLSTQIQPFEKEYGEVLGFLIAEASLLDADHHVAWLDLLTDDVSYTMPIREAIHRENGRGFAADGSHLDDNKMTLGLRARRNDDFVHAFDRNPAPRITRFVSNLIVNRGEADTDYLASSLIMVVRSQYANRDQDMLVARREDLLRRTESGLKLARRVILTNQAELSANYMNVLL